MKFFNKFENILGAIVSFSFVLISLFGFYIENATSREIVVWSLITSIVFLFGLHNFIEFERN